MPFRELPSQRRRRRLSQSLFLENSKWVDIRERLVAIFIKKDFFNT